MSEPGRGRVPPKKAEMQLSEIRVGERDAVRSIRAVAIAFEEVIGRIVPLYFPPEQPAVGETIRTESFERLAPLLTAVGNAALALADGKGLRAELLVQSLPSQCDRLLEALDRELGPALT